MGEKILKIAIITNIIPKYREGFYNELFSRKEIIVDVYCQDRIPGMNYNTIHNNYPGNVHIVSFISKSKDKLVWQFIPWLKIYFNYDVIFMDGNPRVISNLIFGSIINILKKNVVLWTIAHSYNSSMIREKMRLFWSRMFTYIFVYTDTDKKILFENGFSNKVIIGMNNGLDQKRIDSTIMQWSAERLQRWRKVNNIENHIVLISCARLEPKNDFNQFVNALPLIISRVPNLLWCIVGNGPARLDLETLIKKKGLLQHVRFVGEVFNEMELAPWFLSSKVFIHPAAIGLSLLHAFGYGLPVITHGNSLLHGPEYSVFQSGLTGLNFREGDIKDLSNSVIELIENEELRLKMGHYVQRIVREKYNVNVMVDRFIQMTRNASKT